MLCLPDIPPALEAQFLRKIASKPPSAPGFADAPVVAKSILRYTLSLKRFDSGQVKLVLTCLDMLRHPTARDE